MTQRRPFLVPALVLVTGAAVVGAVVQVRAGCLAPSDRVVDVAGVVGPFAGSSQGELLYARDVDGSTPQLVRRPVGGNADVLAVAGETNGFFVGPSEETWVGFHSGTISSQGDVAFVASTQIADDPDTPGNEAIARRGVYVIRGNTTYEVARFGSDSPIAGGDGFVPWASFFYASARLRGPTSRARAVFVGQLGVPDGRSGVFAWDEETFDVTPIALTGDAAPSGGTYVSIARTRTNEPGDVAFSALTELDDDETLPGLFLAEADGPTSLLVAFGLEGDAAPSGGAFTILSDFALADDGTVWFAASTTSGTAPSGIFRAEPPAYLPEAVVLAGDPSPLGGTYASFEAAKVRSTPEGQLVFGVRLSDDVDGEGIFVLDDSARVIPLSAPDTTLAVAALGEGRAAYQTTDETSIVTPSDGTEEGPDDFVLTKLDVKNKVPLRKDSVRVSGAFRLPTWGDGPGEIGPPVLGPGELTRETTDRSWNGDELTRISEVRIRLSQSPGNDLAFGIDGGGTGYMTVNDTPQRAPKVKLAKDGSSARWSFKSDVGRGKMTLDLDRGTFDLKLGAGTVQGSYEASAYRFAFTLRTDDDVGAGRTDDAALFHRALVVAAEQPPFGKGLRVRSDGSGARADGGGGGLFVERLDVKRKLKVAKGASVPTVHSDAINARGLLRICPGSTPPATPGLRATVLVGDLLLDDIELSRRGKSGSRYRYKSGKGVTPKVVFDLDAARGTFSLKAKGAQPLSGLVDADFAKSAATNGSRVEVGGMELPFSIAVDRVYEDTFDVSMVRRKGAKSFRR